MKQISAVEFLHSEYKKILANTMVDVQIVFKISDALEQAKQLEKEQIEDFAVEFSKWCLESLLNGEEPKAKTIEELLEIFKKEKGL